jgi:hypothetical protein
MSAATVARAFGLANVEAAVEAADAVGLPYALAFALLDMESEGANVYGGDSGGIFATSPRTKVTPENYREFRRRLAAGEKSNGVGPCQITWKGFFPEADKQGLDLSNPLDNMKFGFRLLKGYVDRYPGDWQKVGRLYNGKDSYGNTFVRVVGEWEKRLREEQPVSSDWYPAAKKREIRPGSNDPKIKPIGAILHVDAGNSSSLYNYFNGPSNGIESHFHVRKDGTVEQYRAVGYEADANYKGNSFVLDGVRCGYVSIETQGLEKGTWVKAQLEAIKKLLEWLRDEHGIPLKVPSTPKSPGVGYHTLFGAPGDWTPVAKSCPGPDRIKQYREVLVPWFGGEESPEDDTLTPAPKPTFEKLNAAVKPRARHAQVATLQRLLIKAGYGPIKGSVTTYYGANTEAAVARFHDANPDLKSKGVKRDVVIGLRGFQRLQEQVAKK